MSVLRLDEDSLSAIMRKRRGATGVEQPGKVKQVRSRNKYNAVKVQIDGIVFDSKGEGRRYLELRHLERLGEISDLKTHVRYRLKVEGIGGEWHCDYIADFTYTDRDGQFVVEDFKSAPTETRVFEMKAGMMRALHGITIRRVRKSERSRGR